MPRYAIKQLPKATTVPFQKVKTMFFDPFPGQRSHRDHLKDAKYLHKKTALWGDQLVFHAVRYPDANGDWVHQLIDGYTRIEAVLQDLMLPPEDGEVVLLTHTVSSYDEANARYKQLNALGAAKRGKHDVQSGLREATKRDNFNSHLLQRPGLTTGIVHAGLGSDPQKATKLAAESLNWLDELGLRKEAETTGVYAAYVVLSHNEPDREAAKLFITRMNQRNFEPDGIEDEAVYRAREWHFTRKRNKTCSAKANVNQIRDNILAWFEAFRAMRDEGVAIERAAEFTLDQYFDSCATRKAA